MRSGLLPGRREALLRRSASLVVVVAAGCGMVFAPRPRPHARLSATAFLAAIVRETAANHYDETWQTLDSTQQRLVGHDAFVRCESASPIPGHLRSLAVIDEEAARVRVPGRRGVVAGRAVTMRIVIGATGFPDATIVHTFHALPLGHSWRWYMGAKHFRLYEDAACGRPTPPSM